MSDRAATHEMTDVAVLYALGALSQHEARSFEEHMAEGCEACTTELKSFELTVGAMALGAPEEQPSDGVREALLARVSESVSEQTRGSAKTGDPEQLVSILAGGGRWREVQEGILLKNLYVDKSTGIATSLVRMLPGTSLPVHQHLGVEQFFVLEGDCHVAGQILTSGDYHRAAAGSIHEGTYTVDGTMLLLIAPECYEVLDAR